MQFGNVLIPEECRRHGNSGPGARMLDEVDMFVVLVLYMEEPSRSLRSEASALYWNSCQYDCVGPVVQCGISF
jgi:hypothetical protein